MPHSTSLDLKEVGEREEVNVGNRYSESVSNSFSSVCFTFDVSLLDHLYSNKNVTALSTTVSPAYSASHGETT